MLGGQNGHGAFGTKICAQKVQCQPPITCIWEWGVGLHIDLRQPVGGHDLRTAKLKAEGSSLIAIKGAGGRHNHI